MARSSSSESPFYGDRGHGLTFADRFLVIPLHKPDVKHDYKNVNLSPLSLLLSNENRLKVCIVPDKDTRDIGIYLFENYKCCNSALWTIMQLVETTRTITKGFYVGAYMHPCMTLRSDTYFDSGDFTTVLVQAFDSLPPSGEWDIPPFLDIGLVLPTDTTLPLGYLKSLFADMLALLRETCRYYCDEARNAGGRMLSMMSIRMDMWGVRLQEAMMIGECVSIHEPCTRSGRNGTDISSRFRQLKIAFYLDKCLAASLYRMRTAEPVTPAHVRAFLHTTEKAYFATKSALRDIPPGGPAIFDESSGSTLHDVKSTEITIDVFAPFEHVMGTVQYMPIGRGMIQGLRTVMVPPDQGESRIEVLDFPE
jgi:hypothetical protein